ncbi:EAL domain-containing protein [uncultured Cohaesibacter sp.]|uniref:EAL domain-containing protein n=1 Tax=uncultured Cohaesibacter sp. TaxID=1002546 RepID=UPI002930C60E|nr:EAL domain-containing protein [uncultured Cohaesibacter sp.]
MSRSLTPLSRISLGLAGITASLLLIADVLHIIPDETRFEMQSRVVTAEALAIQLANSVSLDYTDLLQATMLSVVERNRDVNSIAVRDANGTIIMQAGDHAKFWKPPHDEQSTIEYVQVPLKSSEKNWGKVEIAFKPLSSSAPVLGLPLSFIVFAGFMVLASIPSFRFILHRTLREFDPSGVVPERVKTAFNTLAEGVLILDERQVILLSNENFAKTVGKSADDLLGMHVNDLNWRPWGESSSLSEPWKIAIRDSKQVTDAKIALKDCSGGLRSFMVNATCILNGKGKASGVIVTFDDVTALQQKNDDLVQVVRKLQLSEEAISSHNRELQFLADHDPLSGCFNRRAFFKRFESYLDEAIEKQISLTCIMIDLDHFKKINDQYGHGIGDEVISGLGTLLRESTGRSDLVGRYGGEEFCIILFDCSPSESLGWAETIRQNVIRRSSGWLGCDKTVTTSIGVSFLEGRQCRVKALVDEADEALYEAKETGRNKVVVWNKDEELSIESLSLEAQENDQPHDRRLPSVQTDEIIHTTSPHISQIVPQQQTSKDIATEQDNITAKDIFSSRLDHAISYAQKGNRKIAVLAISIELIDQYADLIDNDSGTEVTETIQTRLALALNQFEILSLIGSAECLPSPIQVSEDKFIVEIPDLQDTSPITWIVKNLFESLEVPISLSQGHFYPSADIGIALYPDDGESSELLIKRAAIAAQHARTDEGLNNYQFFTQDMNENSRRQLTVEAGIRDAIKQNEFELYYQPIINARSGHLDGVETLLRCNSESLRSIPINIVISVAEQTGLIIGLGEWITKAALEQAISWYETGIDLPRISINLSAVQLNNRDAMERLYAILMESNLPPQKLQLEITETAILNNVTYASTALMRLQQMGISIALDDFGTGQSSLSYLRRFHPDALKIDRCFINEITASNTDETLVSAMITVAQRMGIRVIAEGVETETQMDKLRRLDCDEIQGYFISRPVPRHEIEEWLFRPKRKERLNFKKAS